MGLTSTDWIWSTSTRVARPPGFEFGAVAADLAEGDVGITVTTESGSPTAARPIPGQAPPTLLVTPWPCQPRELVGQMLSTVAGQGRIVRTAFRLRVRISQKTRCRGVGGKRHVIQRRVLLSPRISMSRGGRACSRQGRGNHQARPAPTLFHLHVVCSTVVVGPHRLVLRRRRQLSVFPLLTPGVAPCVATTATVGVPPLQDWRTPTRPADGTAQTVHDEQWGPDLRGGYQSVGGPTT